MSLSKAVPAGSSGALLSVVVRNPALDGSVKIGSVASASVSSVLFSKGVISLVTVASDVTAAGAVNITNSTSKTLVVQVTSSATCSRSVLSSPAPVAAGTPPVPPISSPPAVQTTAGALTLTNLDAYPADNRMIFNRIQTFDHESRRTLVENVPRHRRPSA